MDIIFLIRNLLLISVCTNGVNPYSFDDIVLIQEKILISISKLIAVYEFTKAVFKHRN